MRKGTSRLRKKRMHKPQRQCAACRRMFPKSELLRVAVEKGGEPVVDMTGKMPGRGAYLCRSKKCLQDAERRKILSKSLHCSVSPFVYRELERMIGDHQSE